MSTTVNVQSTPVLISVNDEPAISVTIPSVSVAVSVSEAIDYTNHPLIYYGSDDPPDPTNLPDGTLFFQYGSTPTPSGEQNLYVQSTDPGLTIPGLWIQTGLGSDGNDMTFWVEDGL